MESSVKKVALVEFSQGHVECLYAQVCFLAEAGYQVHIIADAAFKERYRHFDKVSKYHWLDNDGQSADAAVLARQISGFLHAEQIKRVVLNTFSGSILKKLLPQLYRLRIIGIVHDLKTFRKSLFRRFLAINARTFWVLNDHLLQYAPNGFGRRFHAFYPIFFPPYPVEELHKPDNEMWIGIPGQVEFKRKNFQVLLDQLSPELSGNIRFLLLGPSRHKYGDGAELLAAIEKQAPGLSRQITTFDDFLSDSLFHSYLLKCDLLMPLIYQRERYRTDAISGTFNLSFGYGVPMVVHQDCTYNADLKSFAFHFTDDLCQVLNHLQENPDSISAMKEKIASEPRFSFEHQQSKYQRVVEKVWKL